MNPVIATGLDALKREAEHRMTVKLAHESLSVDEARRVADLIAITLLDLPIDYEAPLDESDCAYNQLVDAAFSVFENTRA